MRRILGRLRRRLRPRALRPSILMYHRVAALEHDPWGLAVDPKLFEQQIEYIHRHRMPMSVDEMVQRLKRGNLPAKAIAITFDDAYLDNLVHAKPVLARFEVPATVFVPTGLIGKKIPFWWDELATMILESPSTTESVQTVDADQVPLSWGERESADGDPDWRGWDEPRSQRQANYLSLWSRLQKTGNEERSRVMGVLRTLFPVEPDPLGLPMTEAELTTLIEGDVIRLGAHSVHHASLSDLSVEDSRTEILDSQEQCRAFTPKPVEGFAYPYGNMNPDVCREVMAAGFTWACAAEGGPMDGQPDFFRLPRIAAPNLAGQPFAAVLAG